MKQIFELEDFEYTYRFNPVKCGEGKKSVMIYGIGTDKKTGEPAVLIKEKGKYATS